jgi:glycosyltransferase involved in cell wall biosynthesis
MRIAFEVFGGSGWTGGINYLVNLLSAINELPGKPIQPVLFASPKTDPKILERMLPYLAEPPILTEYWTKGTVAYRYRFFSTMLTQKDHIALKLFRQARIDVTFVHASWFGSRFPIPTLVWIGDFQHREFPDMFSRLSYAKREYGFKLLTKYGTTIMASSESGCEECRRYFPISEGRLESLPFVVRIPDATRSASPETVRAKYGLPERFFYLPNQFWRHKNHLNLFKAVEILKQQGHDIRIICSGNPIDPRDPGHIDRIRNYLRDSGLDSQIKLLGMIPYEEIFTLMRICHSMINPSFYEGWSTTVEEAKTLGVPMLLSDIPVHREQAVGKASFFNAHDPADISTKLLEAWTDDRHADSHLREEITRNAAVELAVRRKQFAEKFLAIAERTLARKRT